MKSRWYLLESYLRVEEKRAVRGKTPFLRDVAGILIRKTPDSDCQGLDDFQKRGPTVQKKGRSPEGKEEEHLFLKDSG